MICGLDVTRDGRRRCRTGRDEAKYEKGIDTAKKALAKGLSLEDAAELADLPIEEVEALVKNH